LERVRLIVILAFFIIFSIVIIGRLAYLQIYKGEYFKELSDRNYIKIFVTNPPRGRIFDRNGVLLAYDIPTFNLVAFPYIVKQNEDINRLSIRLKKILGIDIDEKTKEIIEKNIYQKVVIKKMLTEEQIQKFYNYSYLFKGFYIDVVPRRKYTEYANYLSHIIGYVGYPTKKDLEEDKRLSPDMLVGKTGVEKIYDKYLRGKAGIKAVLVDAFGRQKEVLWEIEPEKGNDIYLTIDMRMQKIAYDVIKMHNKESAAVVILNPSNFDILTILSYPTYDLQKFNDGYTQEEWKALHEDKYKPLFNKALNGLYPPGSIFKPLVGIAAINENVITSATRISSGAEFSIGSYTYRNWDPRGCGYINLAQALEMSCDTFFYQVGLKLGVDNIHKYAKLFGIGEKLNPDIEQKVSVIPNREWKRKHLKQGWYHGDTVNLSIGQGFVNMTPFDAVKIPAVIANGGYVYKPNLLKGYFDTKQQKIIHIQPELIRKIKIKKDALDAVRYGMYLVVYGGYGTAGVCREAGVVNAGKTGTAQVYRYLERHKKHSKWELRDHAWFIDFAPYDNPKIAMVVFIEHGESGGKVAAPIAKDILKLMKIQGMFEE